jgi:hypothetical protein
MKVTNEDIYPHINWDLEIANEEKLEDESEQAQRCSDAIFVMQQMKDTIHKQIEEAGVENMEDHTKANMMRMIEYFYCKFVYHHALVYNRHNKNPLDLKKNETENGYGEHMKHPVAELREKLGETGESNVPLEMLTTLGDALAKDIRKQLDANKPKDGGFDEAKKMFEKEGLTVEKPIGLRKEGDRDTVCVVHDDIRYHLYMMKASSHHGERNQEMATSEANDYKSLIDKYHPLVKEIHDKMKAELPGMENLWVMEGGGMQHQAFFGNEKGYIAILYLGMKNGKTKKHGNCLTFEGYEDEPKWQIYKDFKMEDIECRAFGETDEFKEERAKYE